jgi:predicted Fe-Mo cluster-binding NifX family protein
MKLALAIWRGRISPIFDISQKILTLSIENGTVRGEREETFPNNNPVSKIARPAEIGVNTLICGAISQQLAGIAEAYGVRVIPFVAGDAHEVAQAFVSGAIPNTRFAMPGCRGRHARHSGGRRHMTRKRGS